MKLAFDIDGVVVQSIKPMLEYINGIDHLRLTDEDVTSYGFNGLGVKPETLKDSINFMKSQRYLVPYQGAVAALEVIATATNEPLTFITSRSNPMSAEFHLLALPWTNRRPDFVVVGGEDDKTGLLKRLEVDFFLEDNPTHLPRYIDAGVAVGIMSRPWNVRCDVPGAWRFHDWEAFLNWAVDNIFQPADNYADPVDNYGRGTIGTGK